MPRVSSRREQPEKTSSSKRKSGMDLSVVDKAFGTYADLYGDVLRLNTDATQEQIQLAYFDRRSELFTLLASIDAKSQTDATAKERHQAERRMDSVVLAVRILGDPQKRAHYDTLRKERLLNRRREKQHKFDTGTSNRKASFKKESSQQHRRSSSDKASSKRESSSKRDLDREPSSKRDRRESSSKRDVDREPSSKRESSSKRDVDREPSSKRESSSKRNSMKRESSSKREYMDKLKRSSSKSEREGRPVESSKNRRPKKEKQPRLEDLNDTMQTTDSEEQDNRDFFTQADEMDENRQDDGTVGATTIGETTVGETTLGEMTMDTYTTGMDTYSVVSAEDGKGLLCGGSRIVNKISNEISGAFEDTVTSFDQVFNAFTLTDKDIRAVTKRIDKAKKQLDT